VWSARRLDGSGRVAVKVLRLALPEQVRRLRREARLIQRMANSTFVTIEEVLELPLGAPALVMELLSGEDLSACLAREGAMATARVVSLLLPIVSALGDLHAERVVHRDLKPANLYLHEQGGVLRPRMLDLGMARSLDLEQATIGRSRLTKPGTVFGTPRYMAPEQLEGARDVDTPADIWALGAIAYRMLTGTNHVTAVRYPEVVRELHTQSIADLRELAPGTPESLAAIAHASLGLEPAARPDARAWDDVLQRLQAS
jgi:eukaryotic-like serine/threonine-protein kinase